MMRISSPKQVSHRNVYSLQSAKRGKVSDSAWTRVVNWQVFLKGRRDLPVVNTIKRIDKLLAFENGVCQIPDVIHGVIELSESSVLDRRILSIVKTPAFQRLKDIGQSGMKFINKEIVANRFDHSLGVYEVARRIVSSLTEKYKNNSRLKEEILKYKNAIYFAALLHDLGHPPYSHNGEEIFGINHEEWTLKLIRAKETGISQILENFEQGMTDKVVAVLSKGNTSIPKWAKSIVSGPLDADRCDYLLRDSFHNGSKSRFDIWHKDALINAFALYEDNGEICLGIHEEGVEVASALLYARGRAMSLWNNSRVREATVSFKIAYTQALESNLVPNVSSMSVDEYIRFTDTGFLNNLEQISQNDFPDEKTRKFVINALNGRYHKLFSFFPLRIQRERVLRGDSSQNTKLGKFLTLFHTIDGSLGGRSIYKDPVNVITSFGGQLDLLYYEPDNSPEIVYGKKPLTASFPLSSFYLLKISVLVERIMTTLNRNQAREQLFVPPDISPQSLSTFRFLMLSQYIKEFFASKYR